MLPPFKFLADPSYILLFSTLPNLRIVKSGDVAKQDKSFYKPEKHLRIAEKLEI